MRNPTLKEVLGYTNRDVVYRFSKSYNIPLEEAEDIFTQVKKWLWLSHQRRVIGRVEPLSIDLSLIVIDEMWHNFVLFTREYIEFCKKYFGYYLHHAPTTEQEELEHGDKFIGLSKRERAEQVKNSKRSQYVFVHEQLGEETFVKWYMEYPKKYALEQLADMQRDAVKQKIQNKLASLNANKPAVAA